MRHTPIDTVYGRSTGYVYCIAAGVPDIAEFVKLGFTAGDPLSRMKSLQTGCPSKLHLVGAYPSTMNGEAELHQVLSEDRTIGEWFRWSPYAQSVVRALLDCEGARTWA